MPRILVTPPMLNGQKGPHYEILEAAGLEVIYPPKNVSLNDKQVLIAQLDGIQGIVASIEPLPPDSPLKELLR